MAHHEMPARFIDGNEIKSNRLLLVGQPNIGKSVIFKILTGRYVVVSNYPGTTVEIMSGQALDFDSFVVDTPGVGNILPRSEDEWVTFRTLLSEGIATVLQVGDAKNLRRTLFFFLSLAEAELPMALDLNMVDEAERKGYKINAAALSKHLGVPVILTVATERRGKDDLLDALQHPSKSSLKVHYDGRIETAIREISRHLPEFNVSKRFVAITLLSGTLGIVEEILPALSKETRRVVKEIISQTQAQYAEPLYQVILSARSIVVERLVRECMTHREGVGLKTELISRFERFSSHPFWGYVLLAFVLFGLYEIVGVFAAGIVVDFVQNVLFREYLLPPVVKMFSLIPFETVRSFFVGEYGQITMGLTYAIAIVLPIVTAFFTAFSFLEDSGYLPRLAVMLNRSFSRVGLNGKAVIPMILGFGCGTMAALVTRVLETKRERVIATLLLALGIPCSAQLGIILGIFSQIGAGATVLFFTLLALQMLLIGFLASRILPGSPSVFITELPPYRLPRLDNVMNKTFFRAIWFIREAIPWFLMGTALLFFADLTGFLSFLIRLFSPVVVGLFQLPAKSAEAFIMGMLRRDYGAAGLFALFGKGTLDNLQAFVGMMVMTLFVPCIANIFVIFKERGPKAGSAIVVFVTAYAVIAGTIINYVLRFLRITF